MYEVKVALPSTTTCPAPIGDLSLLDYLISPLRTAHAFPRARPLFPAPTESIPAALNPSDIFPLLPI
jgi:hypothetical protein